MDTVRIIDALTDLLDSGSQNSPDALADQGGGACPGGFVPGDVQVTSLSTLASMRGCSEIEGSLDIGLKDATNVDLGELAMLEIVHGSLFIVGNGGLRSLKSLSSLRSVGGTLAIIDNDGLSELPFPALEHVGDHLWIEKNPDIEDISGFGSLGFAAVMDLRMNVKLRAISGFNSITHLRHTAITLNSELRSVIGFKSAAKAANLQLLKNDKLSDLSGFRKLTVVNFKLGVSEADSLTSLDDFASLESVGRLVVTYNDSLSSVSGMTELATVKQDIVIAYNPLLPVCDIASLLDQVEGSGSSAPWFTIEGNAGDWPCTEGD